MKAAFPYALAPFLSISLIIGLEFIIVLITNDHKACFFHNSVPGNILLWLIRIPLFVGFTSFFYNMFLPRYSSLKDRMMERDETKEKSKTYSPTYRLENLTGEVKTA
jgi:hypothetical protein